MLPLFEQMLNSLNCKYSSLGRTRPCKIILDRNFLDQPHIFEGAFPTKNNPPVSDTSSTRPISSPNILSKEAVLPNAVPLASPHVSANRPSDTLTTGGSKAKARLQQVYVIPQRDSTEDNDTPKIKHRIPADVSLAQGHAPAQANPPVQTKLPDLPIDPEGKLARIEQILTGATEHLFKEGNGKSSSTLRSFNGNGQIMIRGLGPGLSIVS